jgi:hypothetical protein
MYWPEKYQLGIITHYLRDENISYVVEPTLFSIPIDVLGARNGEAYAIELKTKDFKRGIEQAERNTSFVDYSYLAVYKERVTEDLISRLDDSPAGLFSVGEHVECLSPPSRNTPSKHARASVLDCVTNHV